MQARQPVRLIRRAVLVAGVALVAADGRPSLAQDTPTDTLRSDQEGVQVRGRVADLTTGRALPAASIRLVDVERLDQAAWEGLSDTLGVFVAPRLPPASYQIEVEALGFRSLLHFVTLAGYGSADLQIDLAPAALELEPIVVVSRRRTRLETAGFYDRRQRGFGHTLTREEIEARRVMMVTDLVRTMPGVRVTPGTMGRGGIIQMRGGCVPEVILDGVRMSQPVRLDDILSVADLEGIEIYSGASAPTEFSRSSCGTVLAWTRDPGSTGGSPWSWKRAGAAAGLIILGFLLTGR